jgi:hypothetical protein
MGPADTPLIMKQMTSQTRCEKCAEILSTHFEEDGVSRTTFHERLITQDARHSARSRLLLLSELRAYHEPQSDVRNPLTLSFAC